MKAGYGVRDITPPVGLEMCGYGYYLGRVASGVHDRLFARALYLEQGEGRFLLISCDLEGISVDLCDGIKRAIESATGLTSQQVMIHTTHTHSGPACARTRGCGKVDKAYVTQLPGLVLAAAVDAVNSKAEAESIASGISQAPGLAYNRVYGDRGPLDETVRVVVIRTREDQPYVVVNYGCHPVCCGVNDEISADYPGYVVKTLAEAGYKAICITGFCGDINPSRERGYELAERTGTEVAKVALTALESAEELENLDIQTGIAIERVRKERSTREALLNNLREARDRLEEVPSDGHALCYLSWALDSLDAGECRDVDAPLQVAAIGKVVLAGIPGETFTAFGSELRKQHPDEFILTVNEANGVIGYIPTADEFDNNGYSVIESSRIYGEFMFRRGFGEELCVELSELVRATVRS